MVNELQKKTLQAIVNVFETGKIQGEYGQVTLMSGDTGHLTYGRSQTTLASGNLYLLIKDYCVTEHAYLAAELTPYLNRLENRDLTLDSDFSFRDLLHRAGEDPVMHQVQDAFFDRVYWTPSLVSAGYIHAEVPLGVGIIYDSTIHGSWRRMRDRTVQNFGTVQDLGEQTWFTHYVQTRRDWLANHSNRLLRRTVYRMDSFQKIIDADNWQVQLPIQVHGITIDEVSLTHTPTVRASAEDESERPLKLQRPFLRGKDVRQLQQALKNFDITVDIDGIFGPGTEKAVIAFQSKQGLTIDGIVGPATRAALDL
ncbi:MAG: peptidoglycan-binding protein [Gammaproteobacteria bacterium]|nr:peptidoglycan-binding protein [Gammaproteobacteria bacterium]MDH5800614.1 peptidoglycan-binding protein [Gammaproteobacteria bacterium]